MKVLRRIDQTEEQRIREMRDEQRRLHLVPTPVAHIGLTVYDKNGVPTAHYEDRSKSWTRNFYNWMVSQQMTADSNSLGTTFEAGKIAMRDTGGTIRQNASPTWHNGSTSGTTYGNGYRAAGGSVASGIVIGTSDSAESFESIALGALVAEGTGSGQMQYLAMDAIVPVWDGTEKTMTYSCERAIVNNSGNSIGVKEVGLIARNIAASSIYAILMARDVLAETVTVPHESMIKVTYTIQIAYPE
jgi:hypothetical protein